MAASKRITYSTTSPTGGAHLANAVRLTIAAKVEANRAMALANEITNGGVDTANLEGSTEFGAASAQGGALYTAANNLKAVLATITTRL